MSSFFSLDPPIPSTCSPQVVRWNETRYQEPPNVRVLVPGTQALKLDFSTSGSFKVNKTWDVNVQSGTQVVFFVESSIGRVADSRTSRPFMVTTSPSRIGNDCLGELEPKSTVILSTDTSMSTITTAITGLPESSHKVKWVATFFLTTLSKLVVCHMLSSWTKRDTEH